MTDTGSIDLRPTTCRNRARDKGRPYPKSGCDYCHDGGLFGCPFDGRKRGYIGAHFTAPGAIDVLTCTHETTVAGTLYLEFDKMPGKFVRYDLCTFIAPREDKMKSPFPPPPSETKPAKPVINRIERADVEAFHTAIAFDTDCRSSGTTLDFYQRIATKSAIYPGKGTPFGLMYAALGLAEAGEVQNKVKKAFRDDGIMLFDQILVGSGVGKEAQFVHTVDFGKLSPERREQIIKELGGALWYIAAVCDEIGATMSEVALTNLDELCGRGERDTLRGDGDDR